MLFNVFLVLCVICLGGYLFYCAYNLVSQDESDEENEENYLNEDEIIELINKQFSSISHESKGTIRELDEQNLNLRKEPNVLNVDFNKKAIR